MAWSVLQAIKVSSMMVRNGIRNNDVLTERAHCFYLQNNFESAKKHLAEVSARIALLRDQACSLPRQRTHFWSIFTQRCLLHSGRPLQVLRADPDHKDSQLLLKRLRKLTKTKAKGNDVSKMHDAHVFLSANQYKRGFADLHDVVCPLYIVCRINESENIAVVQAFKAGQWDAAIQAYTECLQFDPELKTFNAQL